MSTEKEKSRNWNLLTKLRDAIKQQNKKRAKQLLSKNTIVDDAKCKSVHTLIHWAILKFEDIEILKILIDQGSNVCEKNYHGQTPLNLAIHQQHIEAVKLLLINKAYLGQDFQSFLKTAIDYESEEIVQLLVDYGVKDELFDNLNDILHEAISKKLAKIIKIIIPYCKLKKMDKYISEYTIVYNGEDFYECLDIMLQYGFKMESGCEKNSGIVFDCVEKGHLVILEKLLLLGLNVNMTSDITGLTLLHTACLFKQHKVVQFLLKHHADVNCKSGEEVLAWHTSFWAEEAKRLSTKTPLFIAVKCTDVELLEILLNHGAKVPDDPEFISLINLVAQQDHLELLKVLVNHGLNVNAKMTNGKTLLHECANYENLLTYLFTSQVSQCNDNIKHQIAELLVKHGADIDVRDSDGYTPLFIAIENNYSKMVDFLLENNANVNHRNNIGNTPLHIMANESWVNRDILMRLLEYKVNCNEPNDFGITPFHLACKNWSSSLIQVLLNHGADINFNSAINHKAIHFAAEGLDNQVTRLLLKNGACINDQDCFGKTPFHILCRCFMVTNENIEFFLQNGADINAVDIDHQTPLFYACNSGRLETVKMLLAHQANINHANKFGATPVYIAAERFPEIAEFLMNQTTTNFDFVTQDGQTLLHVLVNKNRIDIIDEYIDTLNIHINTADKSGKTPLFYAAAEAKENAVMMLLRHGADVNVTNHQQLTVPAYVHKEMTKINQDIAKFLDSLLQSFNRVNNSLRLREEYVPFWKKMGCYMKIMQILRQNIIKMKAAGMKLHPQNVRFSIYDHTNTDLYVDDVYNANLEKFEFLCKQEVETLKTEMIPGTNLCLYDILIKDIHSLANHTNFEGIKSFLEKDYLRETFIFYIDIIKYRLTNVLKRNQLLSIARDCSRSSIYFGLPEIVTNQIFSYLCTNEIETLNQALKVIKYLSEAEKEEIKVLLKTDSAKFLRKLKSFESSSDEPIIQFTKKIKRN